MTINYIRHDNEFYGTIKLVSGEEILGNLIATEENDESVLFISDPATPSMNPIEKDGQIVMAMGLSKWMMWSDEDFYIVRESDIVTIAPMSMEAIIMYKFWLRKESGEDTAEFETPINENMGLVGKVSEMRKKLEDQWKNL
jgi:hypothetical protein